MRHLAAVLALATLTSCASVGSGTYGGERMDPDPTLRVYNETGSHVGIYVNGRKQGVVTGIDECIQLRDVSPGPVTLSVDATATPRYRTSRNLKGHRGWELTLLGDYRMEQDVELRLQPAARCK